MLRPLLVLTATCSAREKRRNLLRIKLRAFTSSSSSSTPSSATIHPPLDWMKLASPKATAISGDLARDHSAWFLALGPITSDRSDFATPIVAPSPRWAQIPSSASPLL
ncbi:unnamed protein product [Lampetra planeri]